ncbi:hypothetical protein [Rhodanobacter ginsenosidimutans]|uniref:Lipoprotein n=1 Tax=Rhodanobacter ginsenosidimutans TaxID=490571 RepID=A0ABW0JUG5_9GAMM
MKHGCACLVSLLALAGCSPSAVRPPDTVSDLRQLVTFLLHTDMRAPSFDTELGSKIGIRLVDAMHGATPISRADNVVLADGTLIDSVEATHRRGFADNVTLSLSDAPCLAPEVIIAKHEVTSVSGGSLPSPGPVGAPLPTHTFLTGARVAVIDGRKLIVGFKFWVPDGTECVSSIVIEQ